MKSQRKLRTVFSDFIENVFFSESWWIRTLRLFLLIAFAILFSALWAYWYDAPITLYDLFIKSLRYLVAPFAAVLAAILFGAVYLQDIYELPSYKSALKYLMGSLFDGRPYFPSFSG